MTRSQPATRPGPKTTIDGPAGLDGLSEDEARGLFAECGCASRHWAQQMTTGRPYATVAQLLAAAEHAFDALTEADWHEAFAAHAEIGTPRSGDAQGAAEQAGAARADDTVRSALREANARYRARFGHVFLIRARGRSATEMLTALTERLENSPAEELAHAAAAQREITELRLQRLVRR